VLVNIANCLKQWHQLEAVSDSARLDCELLLAEAMQVNRTYLYTWPDRALDEQQAKKFNQLLQRRLTGEPIAYVLGYKEFWSLKLAVNPSTLIPRPDTELLVETALALFSNDAIDVLDLGTGTGAIALALASERPGWTILATDVGTDAVLLAIDNCRRLGFTNVQIAKSHWYSNLIGQRFDLIVSNPPYIDKTDPHLQEGDVRFEPASALISGGEGLADIETIITGAVDHLNNKGWLLIEHGYNQAGAVQALFNQHGFNGVNSQTDLAGHQRMTCGQCLTTS